jgi:hypothetical protein
VIVRYDKNVVDASGGTNITTVEIEEDVDGIV